MTAPQKSKGGRPKAAKPKNVIIHFRVTPEVKERLARVLEEHPMKDQTELMRDALLRYVESEEKRLGLAEETKPRQPSSADRAAAEALIKMHAARTRAPAPSRA